MLLLSGAWGAPATQQTKQSSRATLDFIAHEQASGAAAAAPGVPVRPTTTPPPPRSPLRPPSTTSSTQQHQRVDAPGMPKKDWELVPPRQAYVPPQPSTRPSTRPSVQRPTPPTYAGVVKDHVRDHDRDHVKDYGHDRTTTPRVYNIPISVEPGYTTSTEASRWYDKLFGKSVEADDSPWGRRRRQVAAPGAEQRGEQKSEIVIGSNAIRVAGARPARPPQSPRAPAKVA
ncbi:uncharacterized protein LOC117650672 isoform X2 [Thrips palmi]|nr:uncharacterized protein LOC117650672 isoform X2 [Thrips palmi]